MAMMSIWSGLSNGIPTPEMSPAELAPTSQEQLQWPMWGQYYENNRVGGEAPVLPEARELVTLYEQWRTADDDGEREKVWLKMLSINAQQVFTIGIVSRAPQPIVVSDALRNVPAMGVYSWDPGAYFGMYHPDTFWIDDKGAR
jgi:peptide/nickel transport system substrate-binding protein